MFFRVLLVGFSLFGPGAARAPSRRIRLFNRIACAIIANNRWAGFLTETRTGARASVGPNSILSYPVLNIES